MQDTIKLVADNWYLLQKVNKEKVKYSILRDTHALVDIVTGDVVARWEYEVNLFLSDLSC